MKFLRHLSLILLGLLPLAAIQPPGNGIEQPSDFLSIPSGEKFLRWYGIEGKNYFIQISDSTDPLRKWLWAPIIETGHNAEISYEVDGTADKGFFRLISSDEVPAPGETLETADFDHDGLSNWTELTLSHSSPVSGDTDNDSLGDLFEYTYGTSPTDDGSIDPNNGPGADTDGDGSTTAQEQAAGTNPTAATDFPSYLMLEQHSAGMRWTLEGPHYKDDPPAIPPPGRRDFMHYINDDIHDAESSKANAMTPAQIRSYLIGSMPFPTQPTGGARRSEGFAGIHVGKQSDYEYHRPADALGLNQVDLKTNDQSHARIWEYRPASTTLNGPVESTYLLMKRTTSYIGNLATNTIIEDVVKFRTAKGASQSAPVDIKPDAPANMSEEQRYLIPFHFVQSNMPNVGSVENSTDLGLLAGERIINEGGIAYVTGGPEAPNLTANFPGLPDSNNVEWRLQIRTERSERGTLDDRTIPATIQKGGEAFNLTRALGGELVGGACTLSYRINGANENTMHFSIRGKNPTDETARAYVTGHVDASFREYAWAMAQSESRQGNRIFNQFNSGGANMDFYEGPNWGKPDGWGIAQIDRRSNREIPDQENVFYPPDRPGLTNNQITTTREVWDWHANIDAMNGKLVEKQRDYNRFIGYFRDSYGTRANWKEPPEKKFGTTTSPAEAWGVMVLYNGTLGVPETTTPTHPKVFFSPWIFHPDNGTWEFRDNFQNYASERVRPEFEHPTTTE